MQTGTIISGGAHTALILFALFGGMFARDELPPPDVAQVTVLSEEEFAALTRPQLGEEPMVALEIPNTTEPTPEPEATPDPEPEPTPEPEPQPEPLSEPLAAPEPEPLPEPEPAPDPDPAPPVPPQSDDRPVAPDDVPRPAPRVSTEPTPPPPPEAETAPEPVEAPDPDPTPQAEPTPEQTPAAPPETTPEIVTEAEVPSQTRNAAPTGSVRPRNRPDRVAPAPRTEGSTSSAASDNVPDQPTLPGLEQLLDQAPQAGAPGGPPMTEGEKETFKLAVRRCWNVDTGSQAAAVTVSILFDMTRDGRVVTSSIRRTAASGGSEQAINAAFEAARRAILRCQNQNGGYPLPIEKYGQWKTVEMTFNPRGMRMR